MLNSAGSEFRGYIKDRYTTLPETTDRILATDVNARWRHAAVPPDGGCDWDAHYAAARQHLLEAFAETHSLSLQQTLYAMGSRVLDDRPEIAEVRLALPNKHHFTVDLSPFGLNNDKRGAYAADRPYGLIEGTVPATTRRRPGWPGEAGHGLPPSRHARATRWQAKAERPAPCRHRRRHRRDGRAELRHQAARRAARPEPGGRAHRVRHATTACCGSAPACPTRGSSASSAAQLPGLAMAARTVGSPQIRNRGTVGGNLGSASPAGDCTRCCWPATRWSRPRRCAAPG